MTYKRQQIIDTIVADLQTILTANGYETNAGRNVERKLTALDLVKPHSMPYLSVCDGAETLEDETNRDVECRFILMIYGYVYDKSDPHKILNSVVGDIKKVLWTNYERSDALSVELAYSTRVTNIRTDEGMLSMKNFSMFSMEVEVEYSHNRTQP